jgi:hypothetical protein
MKEVMRPLQQLPVFVVLRLCTNDEAVIGYWNDIEKGMFFNSP